MRLLARMQLKQTRALQKVGAFSGLDADSIGKIVDSMAYQTVARGTVLCRQGDISDEFYVCVVGSCSVTVRADSAADHGEAICVGTIRSLQFFGETAFEAQGGAKRSATVTAETETVQLLSLKRKQFERLVATGVVSRGVVGDVHAVREQRMAVNRRLQDEHKQQQLQQKRQQGDSKSEEMGAVGTPSTAPPASSSTAVAL
jgi:CRP-like cAMP-binding protein